MALTITLRGQTYVSENPSDSAIFILASLFLPGETEAERLNALQGMVTEGESKNLFGLDLSKPTEQTRATAILVSRLMSPLTQARVAYALKSLFPELPDKLISYRLIQLSETQTHHDFIYSLNNVELLGIIMKSLEFLDPNTKKNGAVPPTPPAPPKPEPTRGRGFVQEVTRVDQMVTSVNELSPSETMAIAPTLEGIAASIPASDPEPNGTLSSAERGAIVETIAQLQEQIKQLEGMK